MNDLMAGAFSGSKEYRTGSTPSPMHWLLPNEPRVVNFKAQSGLTERHLLPALADLEAFFLSLRAMVDPTLFQSKPIKLGKPYPIGQCLEITRAVQQKLPIAAAALSDNAAATRGYKAYSAFRKAGGTVRQVWGDLRAEFFQNAFQVGTLYVDVANDTVTPTKPKVEILPFAEANLVPIADFRHFTSLATTYWQARIYPNHVLPELAPTLPLIHVMPNGNIQIAEATQYMVALSQAKAFNASEEVLRDELMPTDVFTRIITRLGGTRWKLAQTPEQGRQAALYACREQRAKKWHLSRQRANNSIKAALELNKHLVNAFPSDKPQPTQTIRINQFEYDVATLPDSARHHVMNLQVTDQAITHLKQQLAIYQTARTAYARALFEALPEQTVPDDDISDV
tara:strand:- start:987 stop:2177 length:1191 start_codon:yes stop_codon:yes gene_type:complete